MISKDYASYWEAVEAEESSIEFKDFIQKILAHNPDERPSLEKLKAHDWMKMQGAVSDADLKRTIADKLMK